MNRSTKNTQTRTTNIYNIVFYGLYSAKNLHERDEILCDISEHIFALSNSSVSILIRVSML